MVIVSIDTFYAGYCPNDLHSGIALLFSEPVQDFAEPRDLHALDKQQSNRADVAAPDVSANPLIRSGRVMLAVGHYKTMIAKTAIPTFEILTVDLNINLKRGQAACLPGLDASAVKYHLIHQRDS